MQSQHANFVDNYYFGEGIGELKGKIVPHKPIISVNFQKEDL